MTGNQTGVLLRWGVPALHNPLLSTMHEAKSQTYTKMELERGVL